MQQTHNQCGYKLRKQRQQFIKGLIRNKELIPIILASGQTTGFIAVGLQIKT